jgi:hypothetical protein
MVVHSWASKRTINSYMQVKTLGEVERLLTAQGVTLAFHTAIQNHSFKSLDCATTIFETPFNHGQEPSNYHKGHGTVCNETSAE